VTKNTNSNFLICSVDKSKAAKPKENGKSWEIREEGKKKRNFCGVH
jgi:hypothetical protein